MVVKETEMVPLFWLQLRGLPEEACKASLFENVVDAKGRKYTNVLLNPYFISLEVIALGMQCQPDEINEKWCYASSHLIEPEVVRTGPAQEVVLEGDDLYRAGVEQLPLIVEEPGFSALPRTTTEFITKDPETGIRNVGAYSGHVYGNKVIDWGIGPSHHGFIHLRKCRERGMSLQVAIVVGSTPNIALASGASLPYGVDELALAGAIAGEPVKLVKCKTVDLEVPATAEIVIEGEVSNDYMLPAPAYGDMAGYICEAKGASQPLINVTAITSRREPIFTTTVVGYGVNNSSPVREAALYQHLKYHCYVPGVLDVCFPRSGGGPHYCVVQIKNTSPWEPWQVMNALEGYDPMRAKIAVVVDEDIDPRDEEAVNWALSFAMQPHWDVRIITHRSPGLDPSGSPPGATNEERSFPSPVGSSAMLIDATRKWAYMPVALPRKEYMERAMEIWESEGMPALRLRKPWYGYHLGRWTEDDEENAQLSVHSKDQKVEISNLDKSAEGFADSNHAWLLIFNKDGSAFALEPTNGQCYSRQDIEQNPRLNQYWEGFFYKLPSDLRADIKERW